MRPCLKWESVFSSRLKGESAFFPSPEVGIRAFPSPEVGIRVQCGFLGTTDKKKACQKLVSQTIGQQ